MPRKRNAAGEEFPFEVLKEEKGLDRQTIGRHKTVPGDKIRFAGSWEGKPIEFTSEPKLVDPSIHFRTSSNARIQYSRDLGPNYVDLHVHGKLEPESLARLRDLSPAL